jgi:hypothetical protein
MRPERLAHARVTLLRAAFFLKLAFYLMTAIWEARAL